MPGKKKRVAVLGSSGSIGCNALKVIRHLQGELELVGVSARSSYRRLAEQASSCGAKFAVLSDPRHFNEMKALLPKSCTALSGIEGQIELVRRPDVDIVLCAIVGTEGLRPVLEAVRAGKDVALASKEVLVMAGEIIMSEVGKHGVRLIPVDSEHSAIFQCLEGRRREDVSKIILTASGGPFKGMTAEELGRVGVEDALRHPTWEMGPKVTIDSATLMNKALEIVEARWLFGMPGSGIDVVIHPQSVIHSMVEFVDGTVLAQMSEPDMRFPIQYALTYPGKHPGGLRPLDFAKLASLTFEAPDRRSFPSLGFAYEALRKGGGLPAVMNAANETAVELFRKGEIGFTDIWRIIEFTMSSAETLDRPSLDAILSADLWARRKAAEFAGHL